MIYWIILSFCVGAIVGALNEQYCNAKPTETTKTQDPKDAREEMLPDAMREMTTRGLADTFTVPQMKAVRDALSAGKECMPKYIHGWGELTCKHSVAPKILTDAILISEVETALEEAETARDKSVRPEEAERKEQEQ